MLGSGDQRQDRIAIATIVAVAFVAHGLLLLSDAVYWDGLLVYAYEAEHKLDYVRDWFYDAGLPAVYWTHRILGAFPLGIVLGHKIGAFVGLTTTAVFAYLLTKRFRVSPFERVTIAVATLLHPVLHVSDEIIVVTYILFIAMFFVGAWLVVAGAERSGLRKLAMHAVALALFGVSFSLKSLLVYYVGFIAIFFYAELQQQPAGSLVARAKAAITPHAYLLVVPFAFWFWVERTFPTRGDYADYNKPKFSPFASGRAIFSAILNELERLNTIFVDALSVPVAYALAAVAVVVLYDQAEKRLAIAAEDEPEGISTRGLAILGAAILLFGLSPYAVVGKAVSPEGWELRQGLLSPLGCAILFVAAARVAFRVVRVDAKRGAIVATLACLSVLGVATIRSHFALFDRWIMDRSLVENLRGNERAQAASVLWVDNRTQATSTVLFPHREAYRYYELATLFHWAWGDTKHIGFDLLRLDLHVPPHPALLRASLAAETPILNRRHFIADTDLAGPEAVLVVEAAPNVPRGASLVVGYLAKRLFAPATLPAFLRDLTRLDVTPLGEVDNAGAGR